MKKRSEVDEHPPGIKSTVEPRQPVVPVVELRGYIKSLRSSSDSLRVLFSHATPRQALMSYHIKLSGMTKTQGIHQDLSRYDLFLYT